MNPEYIAEYAGSKVKDAKIDGRLDGIILMLILAYPLWLLWSLL